MRSSILVAAVAVALAAGGCARPSVPLSTQETKTFPAAPGKLVRFDVRSLDVEVEVAPASAITATVEVDARSSSRAAARRWVETHTPAFEDSADTLEVRQGARRSGIVIFGYLNAKARVKVTIPPGCRLEIRTTSGDVAVAGDATVTGPVRITTTSGDVKVTGGLKELIVKASSGDVVVRRQALTALEADTTSGDVTLESGSERTIVGTTSGGIRLENLTGALSADASSGEVAASWSSVPADAKLRVRTTSGDVRLRIPEGAVLRGRISTSSGTIRSDLKGGTSDRREHELLLDATGPAAELDVRTSSGDVSVHTHP
ncbi:MAG TPA: DUF4097 family beta strand repeat-containing protein [Thermoanaerobaculaceae bacterium]|nr:DUF4097 family beta strand repeat-containing protein [Thermoanaerobaculaceae bacterium]